VSPVLSDATFELDLHLIGWVGGPRLQRHRLEA
jgi:hypothetical protein